MMLCTVWDTRNYKIIDRNKKQVIQQISHPVGDFKCWGLQLLPGFDIDEFPFIVARDELSLVFLDVSSFKCYKIAHGKDAEIESNLYGHGSILAISSNSLLIPHMDNKSMGSTNISINESD